jgi:hypothetical protein
MRNRGNENTSRQRDKAETERSERQIEKTETERSERQKKMFRKCRQHLKVYLHVIKCKKK